MKHATSPRSPDGSLLSAQLSEIITTALEWRQSHRALRTHQPIANWLAARQEPSKERDERLLRDLRPTLRGQLTTLLPFEAVSARRLVEQNVLGELCEGLAGCRDEQEAEERYRRLLISLALEVNNVELQVWLRRRTQAGDTGTAPIAAGLGELKRLQLEICMATAGLSSLERRVYGLLKLGVEDVDRLARILEVDEAEVASARSALAARVAALLSDELEGG